MWSMNQIALSRRQNVSMRQVAIGSAAAVLLVAALGAVMFSVRSHLSVATTALVLVVPVVVGVAVGGFWAGVVAAAVGFLVYDFVFIPPYYTLSVGAAQNWAALGVYAVVMVLVARVFAQANRARAEAQWRAAEVRRLFDVSELLVRESSVDELLQRIVDVVLAAFELDGVALLMPVGDRLQLVAAAGATLTPRELDQLSATVREPVSLETATVQRGRIQALALATSAGGIGLLALRGLSEDPRGHELLRAFANHLALALERSRLREQVVRAQLLEEVDRLRRSLVGAVSHDLRTPLATIKVSASTLRDGASGVSGADIEELAGLIDVQADRLDRLVANLLDMTRIQSGTLQLRRETTAVTELVDEALSLLGSSADLHRVKRQALTEVPLVNVDRLLICQVLANLIDNALRYAPDRTPVLISAISGPDGRVEMAVTDQGPGISIDERNRVFEMFNPGEAGGHGGLGLAIAKAFVEAHGERIWVEGGEEGEGARFAFTLPVARLVEVV
jgi:two-component system sensor histidine kinase KdpD